MDLTPEPSRMPPPALSPEMRAFVRGESGATSQPPDPCPQCMPGGTCAKPDCGRKRSDALMQLYGVPERTPAPFGFEPTSPVERMLRDAIALLRETCALQRKALDELAAIRRGQQSK